MKKTRNTITQKIIQSRKKSFNKIKKISLSHLQKKRQRINKEKRQSVDRNRFSRLRSSNSNLTKHKTTSYDFVPRVKIYKEHPNSDYKVESVMLNSKMTNIPKSMKLKSKEYLKDSKKISFNLSGDIYNSKKLNTHVNNSSKLMYQKNINTKKEKRFKPININKKMAPGNKR